MKTRQGITLFLISLFIQGFLYSESDASTKVEASLDEVSKAPSWGAVSGNPASIKKAEKLLDILYEIKNNLSIEDARLFVGKYSELAKSNKLETLAELSKLFVFIRVYFAVPEWDKSEAAKFRGGWLPCPAKDGKIQMLVPLAMNSSGKLELRYSGFSYFGPDYDVLSEFDYFLQRYGVRKSLKE